MEKLTREDIEKRIRAARFEGREPMPHIGRLKAPKIISKMNAILSRRETFKTT